MFKTEREENAFEERLLRVDRFFDFCKRTDKFIDNKEDFIKWENQPDSAEVYDDYMEFYEEGNGGSLFSHFTIMG